MSGFIMPPLTKFTLLVPKIRVVSISFSNLMAVIAFPLFLIIENNMCFSFYS